MGMDSFAPGSHNPNCFVVENITSNPKKTIRIFQYPILHGHSRDLLKIPGIAENDIRASLLKGEIRHKIQAGEIVIRCSDIDLLQFNNVQKSFLQSSGIVNGLSIDFGQLSTDVVSAINSGGDGYAKFLFKERQGLIGAIDNINRIFTVPPPDKFIEGSFLNNEFHIYVTHNGHQMKVNMDYSILESGGVGTGYDTIVFVSFTPIPGRSTLEASYVVKAS